MEPYNWKDVNTIESVRQRLTSLNHPDDADLIGLTLVHIAAIYGRVNVIDFLLSNGCSANSVVPKSGHKDFLGMTPLHFASLCGRKDCLELLLKAGAKVDSQTVTGSTPLHYVCTPSSTTVDLFVAMGGDLNATNRWGHTPFILGCEFEHGSSNFIERMINAGAVPNTQNNLGFTALHYAALYGEINAIKFLLELGVSVDERTKNGDTSLHLAALKNQVECCEFLINSGAEVNAENKNLKTPLALAMGQQAINSVQVLIARGATGSLDEPIKPIGSNQVHVSFDLDYGFLDSRRLEVALDSVRILISSGASATKPDLNGCTPLHICFMPDYFGELVKDVVDFYSGIDNFDD